MPGRMGWRCCTIKQQWTDIPVMMVTAYGNDERADEYGAAEFITQPVNFRFLKQQLQTVARTPV